MPNPSNKELWIDWTHDAMGVLETNGTPEDLTDPDDIADQMVDVSTAFADQMLDEVEERFGQTGTNKRRKRKPKRRAAEEEDDG